MESKYKEIYDILMKMHKLDATTYSKLLSVYGEILVNQVIEDIIDKDDKSLLKFDYYVSRIIAYDNMVALDSFDAYGLDLASISCLSREKNIELATNIYYIIKELQELIVKMGYDDSLDELKSVWIEDKVDYCIKICNDTELLDRLKKLYNKFLFKRNELVEGNLRLVIMIARKFHKSDTIFKEAIQYGNIGLMRAVEKYDPSFGTSFSTYAYYWIKQSIIREIPGVMYSVTIPVSSVRTYYEMKKVVRELTSELHRVPTDLEIANYMGVSERKIYFLKQAFMAPVSLYEPAFESDEPENLFFINILEDKLTNMESNFFSSELREQLYSKMRTFLRDDEIFVIERRFGFYDGTRYTLELVGKDMGVTRERIRQIEQKAIQKLRVKCKDLSDYLY